jgi:hypothetical protein
MRRSVLILAACTLAACDLHITNPAPVTTTPTAPGAITITNTNTNTASTDRSDTDPGPTLPGGGGTPTPNTGGGLPLPSYGESVAREVAAAYAGELANSCEITHGPSAWAWLDRLVRTLQARDARWGYLCKDAGCTKVAADIVAYKASAGDTGFWIVDVIGNHCPNPTDVVQVRWGVLPFETVRRWIGVRP